MVNNRGVKRLLFLGGLAFGGTLRFPLYVVFMFVKVGMSQT